MTWKILDSAFVATNLPSESKGTKGLKKLITEIVLINTVGDSVKANSLWRQIEGIPFNFSPNYQKIFKFQTLLWLCSSSEKVIGEKYKQSKTKWRILLNIWRQNEQYNKEWGDHLWNLLAYTATTSANTVFKILKILLLLSQPKMF